MSSMDTSPISSEPMKKIIKAESPLNPQLKHKQEIISSPQANIVQWIKYVLAGQYSQHSTKTLHTYYEITENITVFNLQNGEMVVVNAPLHEIRNWKGAPIPYICLSVGSHVDQHTVTNRTSIMLSSLYHMSNCAIGVKVDEETCKKTGSQLQDLTTLRRTIWKFLVNKIPYMPPHLSRFMQVELKSTLATAKKQKPAQSLAENTFKTPGCPTPKVK